MTDDCQRISGSAFPNASGVPLLWPTSETACGNLSQPRHFATPVGLSTTERKRQLAGTDLENVPSNMANTTAFALNYNHLFYFYRVAEHGSLSAAARELQLTQPTVSAQIKTLERQLGRQLFKRKAGGALELSDQGRRVLDHARRMFKESDLLLREMVRPERNTQQSIRVGIVPSTSAPFVASVFMPLLQDLHLRPNLTFGTHDDLLKLLSREEVDLVVTDTAPSSAISANFNTELFYAPRLLAVAGPEVAAKIGTFPDDLQKVGIAHYSSGSSVRSGIDVYFAERGLSPEVWVESDDVQVQIEAVRKGFGVAFVPQNLRETVAHKGLIPLGHLGEVRMTVHGVYLERTATEHVRSAVRALIQPTSDVGERETLNGANGARAKLDSAPLTPAPM